MSVVAWRTALVLCSQATGGGGIERLTASYVSVLEDLGYRTQVSSLDAFPRSRIGRARFVFRTIAKVARSRPQLVLVTHVGLSITLGGARLLSPRTRRILVVHGREVWGGPKRRSHLMGARQATSIIAESCYTAAEFAGHWPRIEVPKVVYPPVTLCRRINGASPESREARAAERTSIILSVTRLDGRARRKHVDVLVAAMAELERRGVPLKLEIVGDGDDRARLEDLTKSLAQEHRVLFLGRVNDDELRRRYHQATLFALPSTQEGFGLVFLEAMAHGLPVVGADAGSLPELVTPDVGRLVEPGDAIALADAIEEIAKDPVVRGQMAAAAAERARTFSGDRFARQLRCLLAR